MKMSSIIINGKSYIGGSVSVSKNKITIDGTDVTPDTKVVNITVNGDVDKVSADYCEKIIVNGNANTLTTTSGDIECKDVTGDIKVTSGDIECKDVTGHIKVTSGDIECSNVGGSIQTVSGDVKAENVSGNVTTLSGDIKYRK